MYIANIENEISEYKNLHFKSLRRFFGTIVIWHHFRTSVILHCYFYSISYCLTLL